jgi:hypothetical protein
MYRIEHRTFKMGLPAFSWRDPPDQLRTIGDRLCRMKAALFTSKALTDDLGLFVDEYTHETFLDRVA